MSESGSTYLNGVIVMISSMLECGVLFLPLSFKILGNVYGTLSLFGLAGLSLSTLIFISYLTKWFLDKKKIENNNIDISNKEIEISYRIVGEDNIPKIGILIDLCIFAQRKGYWLIYLLTIRKWLDVFFPDYSTWIYIFLISLSYFLSTRKNFYKLKPIIILKISSFIYLMLLLIVLALIKFFTVDNTQYMNSSTPVYPVFEDQQVTTAYNVSKNQCYRVYHNPVEENIDYRLAIGSIIFALGCHQSIVKVFSELKNKKMSQINLVSFFSITVCGLIYFIIGICGHYIGGDKINGDILKLLMSKKDAGFLYSFDITESFGWFCIRLGVILFSFAILCGFPIQMHPTRESAINIIYKLAYKESKCEAKKGRTELIVTFVLLIFVIGLSFWPNISAEAVVSFIGLTATNCITYIIPSLLIVVQMFGIINIFGLIR